MSEQCEGIPLKVKKEVRLTEVTLQEFNGNGIAFSNNQFGRTGESGTIGQISFDKVPGGDGVSVDNVRTGVRETDVISFLDKSKGDIYDLTVSRKSGVSDPVDRLEAAWIQSAHDKCLSASELAELHAILKDARVAVSKEDPSGALCGMPYNTPGRCETNSKGDNVWEK